MDTRNQVTPDWSVSGDTVIVMKSVGSVGFEKSKNGGLRITFQDLSYSVPSRTNKKERAYLLQNVSGYFEPMQMAALMGPSGSGKTTLLDVLAGRKNEGKTEGAISFSGQKPSRAFLRRYTGYVEQFDTLIGQLTVFEMLMYTAEMKRSRTESFKSKKAVVEDVIRKLALETCRDVLIGSQLHKGISGGQAKRTNIGIAMVTNPRVLFLDEPTSGLDSFTSNEVMMVVKNLLQYGTTICATIHSPSAHCFSLFDRVMLLVRGQMVFFGAQGEQLVNFAQQAASASAANKGYCEGVNDAEWIVDLFTEADRKGQGAAFADYYAKSQLYLENQAQLAVYQKEDHLDIPEDVQNELSTTSSTVTPWWWGIKTLVKYRTTRNYRDPAFLGPRIVDKLFMSFLILTLYVGIGDKLTSNNYINISAVLFMWTALPAYGAASYVPSLFLERGLFARERNDGLYHVITYLLAKMLDELIISAVASLGFAALVFYVVQFQGQFVLFWLVYFITLSIGIVLAYFVAAFSPNLDAANALVPTYCTTLLFFGGFIISFDSMPAYWKWYSYIGFVRYAWGALMVNQFDHNDPIWNDNTTVLATYSFQHVDKWSYVGYLSLFFPVFFALAWITMSLKKYQSR